MKNSIAQFVVTVVFLNAALVAAASGQDTSDHFTETISVGYVAIPFVALDERGKPLENLSRKEVKVLVDGQPVALDMFEHVGNAPVSYTILLDGSGSMGLSGKMDGARIALHALTAQHNPGDDYSLYVFSEGQVREVVPFTSDPGAVMRAVWNVHPFGKTAFFDALSTMPDRSILGKNGSRAIILLTDGFDNASSMTRAQLARTLEGVDVPIYPLGLRVPGAPEGSTVKLDDEALQDLEILREVAFSSGGRLAIVTEPAALKEAILQIEKDLRSQYLVGFSPTGRGSIKYRRISLRLPRRARSVQVRGGYHGTEPPRLNGTRRQ